MNRNRGKLCVFGCYKDSELYPRNRTLINYLSELFEQSVEVRPDIPEGKENAHKPLSSFLGLTKAMWDSATGILSLFRKRKLLADADLYFVPYPAYLDLIFLQLFCGNSRRKKIAIDGFLCLHDTVVHDRKLVKTGSLPARAIRSLESRTLRKADLVFIDTEQQKELLIKSYQLDPGKIIVTPVGIDEDIWNELPALPLTDKFHVLFWGTFIPLHGVETIMAAARIISKKNKDILIKLIGDGQTARRVAAELTVAPTENIEWRRELVSARTLQAEVAQAHCVLGIFGTSDKAGNVIPYKAYQAMASNKILITRESPAFIDLFGKRGSVTGLILVPPGSPEQLASSILKTFKDYDSTRQHVATRDAYQAQLSNRLLQPRMNEALNKLGL